MAIDFSIPAGAVLTVLTEEERASLDNYDQWVALIMATTGSPLVAHNAGEMEDTNKIYVYVGSETGYTYGNWYYHDGTEWVSGGVYNSFALQTDKSLLMEDEAADSAAVGEAIANIAYDLHTLQEQLEDIDALSSEVKEALLACFQHVAWTDEHGRDYYDALYEALYDTKWQITQSLTHCTSSNAATEVLKGGSFSATISPAVGYVMEGATVSITMGGTDVTATAYSNGVISIPAVTGALVISVTAAPKTISSLAAVFTQGDTEYGTNSALDTLKDSLVVTATYDDQSTEVLSAGDYTLSGELEVGTNTITVGYGGSTTTFNVTVDYLLLVQGSALTRKVGLTHSYPYYGTANDSKRISYVPFDLRLSGGKTYRVSAAAVTGSSTPRMGCQFYNQKMLNAVENNTNGTSSDIYDPGWITSYSDGVISSDITVSANVNSSPIRGVRFTFSLASDATIPNSFVVSKITVNEVTE